MKLFVQGIKSVAAGQYVDLGEKLTFLVGPNSAGKSTLIAALDLLRQEHSRERNFNGIWERATDAMSLADRWMLDPQRHVLDNLDAKDIYANPNDLNIFANISSVGLGWSDQSERALIYSALHSGSYRDNFLHDIFDFNFVRSEAGVNELINADGEMHETGKITYLEGDSLLLEEVYFGRFGEGVVFPIESEYANFQEVVNGMLSLLQGRGEGIQTPPHKNVDAFVDLLKNGIEKGRLCWHGMSIRRVISGLFKGKERQRALNIIDRYSAMLDKYRKSILKKYSALQIPEFTSIAPERLIPIDQELKGIVGEGCESCGYMSLLMESAVDRDWPKWVTGDLYIEPATLIENVNRSLSTHLFSDAGYQVVAKSRILIAKEDLVAAIGSFDDEIDLDPRIFYCELSLMDSHGRSLKFSDVGSGIGFVFPILVACHQGNRGLIVQQPELHLHPALQASLADVFIEATAGKKIICETHSEHLILRALRRVRQTSAGTLIDPALALQPNDLAFNYFEPLIQGSTKIHSLRVSEDGDFIDRWPNGFFAERDQELFGE